MRIRFLKGVAGNWKGRDFRFSKGSEVELEEFLARDMIRGGNAVEIKSLVNIPTPEAVAITPTIRRADVIVKKRGRKKTNV